MLSYLLSGGFDENFIIFIQSNFMFLESFFKQVGILVGTDLVIVLTLVIFWAFDKQLGKVMAMSYAICSALTQLIKHTFLRKRPYMANSQIKCLQHPKTPSQSIYNLKAQGYSFPSGHTSSATAVYGSLANYLRNRYVTIVCVAIIAVVSFSRIFLGVHFPSDVLAGLIVGLVSVFLVSFLFNRFDSFWPYLILFIFMIPGIFLGGSGFHAKMSLFLGFSVGFIFEENFVNFEKPKNIKETLLRCILGIVLFLVLNFVFSMEFFDLRILKLISIFLTYFILVGIYPMLFGRINL